METLPMSASETSALEGLVDSYIAAWNARDAGDRAALVARTWTPDATYADPLMSGAGHAGIDAMIAAAQGQYPGLIFSRRGAPDVHGDNLRFSWDLGPQGGPPMAGGTDFAVVEGGRIRTVTGFLDFAPATAA
jgi:hypothetical protein